MTYQIESSSSDDTLNLGERLGSLCRGGEVIVLSSDLGGGKTTLTKGLAKGLGSQENVGSPTFTVARVYTCRDGLTMHHFDFYRLGNNAGVVAYELAEVLKDPQAIVVIEWGNVINEVLPPQRLLIEFHRVASGEDNRMLNINFPEELAYFKDAVQ